MRLAVAGLLALAVPARADVIADAEEPAPITKLGFRIGFSRIPLADTPLAAAQLGIGVEHPVFGELRVFGEYEWLWLSEVPEDPQMPSSFAGAGHRTHLGVRRTFASKRLAIIRFYADVETGGGLGLYDAPAGPQIVPHAFVGLRGGYQITKRRARAARQLETELHFRVLAVEHGVGFGGGLGFYWGD